MESGTARPSELSRRASVLWRAPLPRGYTRYIGRQLLRLLLTVQGLGAFALITLGVMVRKFRVAPHVIHPLIRTQLARSGLRLLPMVMFIAAALGLVVIGQMVALLTRVNATQFLGPVMVTVVVRELGPLLTALIVLSRTGTESVIELGTARALGEVEALEALGIDPVHYLVVPRVVGMALSIFALTVYFILGALASGYLWAFLQDVPLRPGEYVAQIAASLSALDFVTLALKALLFGAVIATVTCYHGLAQPLRLEQVSGATVSAVAQSIVIFLLLDALFLVLSLLT